jgi:hypothetical protein
MAVDVLQLLCTTLQSAYVKAKHQLPLYIKKFKNSIKLLGNRENNFDSLTSLISKYVSHMLTGICY